MTISEHLPDAYDEVENGVETTERVIHELQNNSFYGASQLYKDQSGLYTVRPTSDPTIFLERGDDISPLYLKAQNGVLAGYHGSPSRQNTVFKGPLTPTNDHTLSFSPLHDRTDEVDAKYTKSEMNHTVSQSGKSRVFLHEKESIL